MPSKKTLRGRAFLWETEAAKWRESNRGWKLKCAELMEERDLLVDQLETILREVKQ